MMSAHHEKEIWMKWNRVWNSINNNNNTNFFPLDSTIYIKSLCQFPFHSVLAQITYFVIHFSFFWDAWSWSCLLIFFFVVVFICLLCFLYFFHPPLHFHCFLSMVLLHLPPHHQLMPSIFLHPGLLSQYCHLYFPILPLLFLPLFPLLLLTYVFMLMLHLHLLLLLLEPCKLKGVMSGAAQFLFMWCPHDKPITGLSHTKTWDIELCPCTTVVGSKWHCLYRLIYSRNHIFEPMSCNFFSKSQNGISPCQNCCSGFKPL